MQKIFDTLWNDTLLTQGLTPTSKPQGFVLGGQPGAGKSYLLLQVCQELSGNVLIVNGDEYRKLHPEFDAIQAQYGLDAPKYTGQFAGEITEMMLARAANEHFNIAIEGTFRTAETPLKTLKLLKDHGYETHVYLMNTPASESWLNVQERYAEMDKLGIAARMTPKEHHDLVISKIAENTETVKSSDLCDHFKAFSR